jgi:hypothetical protein
MRLAGDKARTGSLPCQEVTVHHALLASPRAFAPRLPSAFAAGLADPFALLDAQRLELLRRLRDLQDVARSEDPASEGVLLLEGAALRLQADIRWLETCERWLAERKTR